MNIERISVDAPEAIKNLFQFPYIYFSYMTQDKKVLDIAAGAGVQRKYFDFAKKIFQYDIEPVDEKIMYGSIADIPLEDNSVDISFSLETIEHLAKSEQYIALSELKRVTDKTIIIGSVDKYGEDYIEGHEIFKAVNGKNPYHLFEHDGYSFRDLLTNFFKDDIITFMQSVSTAGSLEMRAGLSSYPKAFCNYAVINL